MLGWVVALIIGSASADVEFLESFRCGNKFVELGMSVREMRDVCGNIWPDEIRTDVNHYKTPGAVKNFVTSLPPSANTYQFWIYRDYGKFNTWVWVVNGRVDRIEVGERN